MAMNMNPAGQQQCCCAANTPGPLTVLDAEGVSTAPQPTMSSADLRPGQTVEHHDFRGDIYRFKVCTMLMAKCVCHL